MKSKTDEELRKMGTFTLYDYKYVLQCMRTFNICDENHINEEIDRVNKMIECLS